MQNHVFMLLLLVTCTCFSVSAQSTQEIRSIYQRIQKELPHYASKSVPIFGMSAEGGEATGYYKDSVIQKLSGVFLGESGKRFVNYYYKDAKPVFVLSTSHNYNRPVYYTKEMAEEYGEDEYFDGEKTRITEESFYLKNDSVYIWLNNDGNPADMGTEDKKTKAEELSSTSKKLQELLTNYKEEGAGY